MSIPRCLITAGMAAALLLPRAAAAQAPSGTFFPYPVHEKKLANGLTVIVVPMPGSGLASIRTVVRTGSRDEYERGHTGFAHFFEHMMFRGTKKMSAEERERVVTQMGAATNASTDDDLTVYQFDIAAEDLERVMELESDRFMNLFYAKPAFQTEAGAVYGEYRKTRASPEFQLIEKLVGVAFKKHTYSHTTIGYEKDIAAMPSQFEYSRKFFQRYYRPENTVLLIVGDVDPAASHALAAKYWSSWKKGYVPPKIPREPEQTAERKVEVTYQGKTLPIIALAYKGGAFAPDDLDWVSSQVLAEVAFGETSALYKKLVLDERIVQELEAQPSRSRDPGLFGIYAVVSDPTKVNEVRAALEAAIASARTELADARKVADVVSHMRYQFLLSLATPEDVSDQLSRYAALTGGVAVVDQLFGALTKVTPESVRASADKLLDPRRRTVGILREKGQ
ncbi:MAG TPA: pitrilysin family protein [Kofleriaceae bacterium]|nr:pitrilysin family protein [Kofleriaceae bacterium]